MARKKAARSAEKAAGSTDQAATDVKYGEAVTEIEEILESIDRDEVDIDDLSVKVERAVALIRLCQDKLRATEAQVTQVLDELGKEMEGAGAEAETGAETVAEAETETGSEAELEEDGLPF